MCLNTYNRFISFDLLLFLFFVPPSDRDSIYNHMQSYAYLYIYLHGEMLLSLSSQGSRDSVSLTILEGLAPSEGRLLLSSRLYPRHDAGHSRQRSHAAHGFTKKFGMASWTLEGPIMCDSIFKDLQVSSNILVPVA